MCQDVFEAERVHFNCYYEFSSKGFVFNFACFYFFYSCKSGVFNLSESAGHIDNFNDARGPQSYTAAFRIVSCIPDAQRKFGKVAGASI
jgi:hypothetical protein